MVYNKVYAQIGEERHIVLDPINYQYDIKQILVIQGETVPDYYEADVCNVGDTATLTMVGTAADGVEIPDKFLLDGRNVLVYIVIPGSGGDVQTRYDITIPVDERAEREDIDPSEAEQQQIDSLINALNSGVGRAETAATAAEESATDAEGSAGEAEDQAENAEAWAVGKRAGTDVETEDPTYHNNSKYYAGMAEAAAEEAGQHEASWESWVQRAETAADDAEGSARAAAGSKADAAAAAQTANQKAAEAGNSATAAAGSAASARQTVDGAIGAINTAKEGALTAIGSAGSNAVGNVNQAGAAQVTAVNQAGDTQVQAVEDKGDEVLDSIPQDYSDLVDDVADLTRQISDVESAIRSELDFFALEQGSYNTTSGNPIATSKYVRSTTKIVNKTHINTGSDSVYIAGVFIYNEDGSFNEYINPGQRKTDIDINPGDGKYALFSLKSSDDSDIAPGDIQPNLTMTNLLNTVKEVPANTEALMDTFDVTGALTSGYGINTSQSIGTVINNTPVVNNALAYAIIPCKYKDKFTITGKGGSTYRLWCFTDENYRAKSSSSSNATATNLELTATCDGYFIVNVLIAENYSLKAFRRIDLRWTAKETKRLSERFPEYTHITNPHYLFWRMGAFDSNGAQAFSSGMLAKDRFFTIVKVKSGSKVSKKGARTKNISFGYKLSESDATLTDYTSNAGDSITIQQDCIAYIGIRYSDPVADLLNDSILDEFDFDLMVIDYKSRYSRGEGVKDVFVPITGYAFPRNYGTPCPEIYYEGQHTDTTGWTNSFSDIDAIHNAFDALVASSGSYLVKKNDYGVAYTGNAGNTDYDESSEWHLFEYTTAPINASADSVPKVAITCTMHGNEKMSTYAMYYLMYDLIHNAEKNPVLSWLKANCIITFIPICNPYGFMKAIPSRLNENGVNLNRNFPTYNWSEWEDTRTDGNGSEPGGLNYKGESAASESETKMMMQFYRNNYDAVFAIDLHTNGADTVSRDMVSAYMRALPQDTSDLNYQLLNGFLPSGKTFTNRIRPWLNGKYNAGISYAYAVGTTNPISYYPCAPHWVRETAGLIGVCYEVLAGSSNGFLGEQLTVYSPASIKAAAENLGNFIVAMVAHCKNLT